MIKAITGSHKGNLGYDSGTITGSNIRGTKP